MYNAIEVSRRGMSLELTFWKRAVISFIKSRCDVGTPDRVDGVVVVDVANAPSL